MRRLSRFSLSLEYEKMMVYFERKHITFLLFFLKERDQQSKNRFEFIEISEEICLSLRPVNSDTSSRQSYLHLGFPFPVASKPFDICLHNYICEIFFRGEGLRSRQRKILKNGIWLDRNKIIWKEKKSISDFRKCFSLAMVKYPPKKLLYVDPYSFIGDSVIGMHFIDGLISLFNFSGRIILSKSADDLRMLGEIDKYSVSVLKKYFKANRFIVFPDLLDINFERTLEILQSISSINGIAIFPGRSLFAEIIDGKIYIYHLKQADVILRGKNIEDYMNECLRPFIDDQLAWQEPFVPGKPRVILVNPFGSLPNKTIDLNFTSLLCGELLKVKNIEVKILGGVKSCPFHQAWVRSFLQSPIAKRKNCRLLFFSNLGKFAEYIKQNRPGAVITADTSIAHMMNRLHIPNTVFCHASRFDNNSLQSMISESPLGFGRYFNNNFPVLIRDYKKISPHDIASFLLFLSGYLKQKNQAHAYKKSLAALNKLFPEKYFYSNRPVSERVAIKNILNRISPINKFKKYE